MSKKKQPSAKELKKQRTREHIIADWSANYLERFVLENGFAADRRVLDYGYDVVITTFDEQGYIENGEIKLQLKATDNLEQYDLKESDALSFEITRADYNLWMGTIYPVFLILYDAQTKRAYWQYVQAYFTEHPPKKKTTKTLRVRIPKKNVLKKSTIQLMRTKLIAVTQQTQGIHHV